MRPDEPLLRAIFTEPGEDAPRLVYADWLDEHDQSARAAFIRAQCELARLDPDDPATLALKAREADLLMAGQYAWGGPFRGVANRWEFRRGFVEEVALPLRDGFARRLAAVCAAAPVRELVVQWRPESRAFVGELAACLELAGLTALRFHSGEGTYSPPCLRAEDVRELVRSPYLAGLTRLDLAWQMVDMEGVRELLASPLAGQLRSLNLSGNDLATSGALDLMFVLTETQLRKLILIDNGFDSYSPLMLFNHEYTWTLETLDLTQNPLGPDGVRRTLEVSRWVALRTLGLRGTQIGPAGWTFRGEEREEQVLTRLERIDLAWNSLGDDGARAVAGTRWDQLHTLDLSGNGITASGADALRGGDSLTRLRTLRLGDNDLGDEGVKRLVRAPGLRRLALGANRLTDAAAFALAESPHLDGLLELDLVGHLRYPTDTQDGRRNTFGPDAVRALRERFGERVRLFEG